MRIDRLLIVGVLTVCVMTGCKSKKENTKPAATQINSVSSQSYNIH
jgi:predicted component of type VI protein secretion system